MRSIRIDASARQSTGVVIPPARVSSGTSLTAISEFSCILPDILHPTSYLPSHRSGFASRSSHRSKGGIGTMKVLTPAALTPHGGSLRLLRPDFRASRSQPLDGHAHRFDRHHSLSVSQGFALQSQAHRTIPPKRIRQPTGYAFASCCSPPRLPPHERKPRPRDSCTTQLLSASHGMAPCGGDLHPADKTSSRTHGCFAALTRN